MIQRRKAATYGKVSRKPISDFSAFAQASESGNEHVYQTYNAKEASTTGGPTMKLVQRSALSKLPRKPDKNISVESQRATGHGQTKARSNAASDDYSFSDEDERRNASTSDTGSSKRRKLTPMKDGPLTSVVFDDDSLQRHIAAEVHMESSVSTDKTGVVLPEAPLTYVRNRPEILKQKKHSPVNVRDPTSTSQPHINATYAPKTIELRASSAKQHVLPKYRDVGVPMRTSPSRKTQGIKECHAQPSMSLHTPPKNNALPVVYTVDQSESKQSQIEQAPLPSTPSRPRSRGGVATTPKQRELWGKLLSFDTQIASPSVLDLPGLHIVDKKSQPEKSILHPKMQSSGRAESMGIRKRPTRLVDFLVTSDRDKGPSTVESSEENESSDAESPSSIDSEVLIKDDALNVHTLSSAGNQNQPLKIYESGLVHNSQPISSLQEAPKVTYIRERTHLGDSDFSDAATLKIPLVTESGISRKRQWGASDIVQGKMDLEKDIFDDLDDAQELQGGAMRSIHELREAGGNTRIIGELEAILDDLDEQLDSSTSARRSSLMSLTSRLLEASTCRMLVDQCLEPRLLALVTPGHDIIENSLLAIAILQIQLHTTSAAFLSQANQVRTTNFLVGLLGHTHDLAKQTKFRETNMSKLAQSEYSDLCSSVLRSPVWRRLKPSVLSGQILALQSLELLIRQVREAGSSADILSANAISCIAQNAIPSVKSSQTLVTSSNISLQLAVSILESSTLNGAADIRIFEWTEMTFERICGIFPLIADVPGLDFGYLRSLTLRLYLNLTNTNATLCETFSKPPLVSTLFKTMRMQFTRLSEPDAQDRDLSLLDNLILSLGCLINLAESSQSMRQLVMDLKTPEGSFLEILLQLFLKKRGKAAEAFSEEEAGNNVAFGYLSVLLSYLCINDAVRSYVNARLEGPNLTVLLDAVEEFLNYHRQIDDGTVREHRGQDRRADFVDRLQGIVDNLRSSR